MTVHLITVGNSIRDKLAERLAGEPGVVVAGNLQDASLLGLTLPDRDDLMRYLCSVTSPDDDEAVHRDRAVLQEALARLGLLGEHGRSGWPTTISAESTSVKVVCGTNGVSPGDLMILLASDTVDGMLSALWNACFLTAGADPSVVDFSAGPHRSGAPWTGLDRRGRVRIQVVPQLDLSRPRQADQAMRRLAEIARAVLVDLGHAEKVVVHLSGGYKATIPFLIGIAEGMRSVDAAGHGPAQVTAHVVHDSSIVGDDPTAVPIPLRRFDQHVLQQELMPFTDGRARRADLTHQLLFGYAYDTDGEAHVRLTPFGHGLMALVGQPCEASE